MYTSMYIHLMPYVSILLIRFLVCQELQLEEGDIVTVVGKEDDVWWCGNFKGKIGMFPSSYVEKYVG